jgi:hypothetical protein
MARCRTVLPIANDVATNVKFQASLTRLATRGTVVIIANARDVLLQPQEQQPQLLVGPLAQTHPLERRGIPRVVDGVSDAGSS